ncbi:hypothetical protein CC86DRAFT_420127 [Ophiobolus disseminans]|uniref:DUF7703 domain-containing protein n=1 Tax=Ophiobolus disseminans TaxID=1469910 RepID=A0A6A6ZUW1_9PLEO|nr:hypothetical protein CC86DRAFT_420127 [Ophiobolus disseminans]
MAVNALAVVLDITILLFQYSSRVQQQASWRILAYSVKLKFEFDILQRLIAFTERGIGAHGQPRAQPVPEGREGGIIGRHGAQGNADVHVCDLTSSNSVLARAEKYGRTDIPLQPVIKTTELRVQVSEDRLSEHTTTQLIPGKGAV